MNLRKLGEDRLVKLLTGGWKNSVRTLVGVGDDCAVLRGEKAGGSYLFKTDAIVENVHFTAKTPPALVGRKALARALSDIAAMGGEPVAGLVTLGLPPQTSVRWIRSVYRGLTALAQRYEVDLVGGETTQAPVCWINMVLWGKMRGAKPVLRSTAKPGDLLWVTGRLGKTQQRHHLTFLPRLEEGQWLARSGWVTAMMDLSDGLGADLPRLARASRVSYRIEEKSVPRRPGASYFDACQEGEDYELLFTTLPFVAKKLRTKWPFSTRLTCVGEILKRQQPAQGLPSHSGYDHFQQR
jgi:thiamine-monophosphate kinase